MQVDLTTNELNILRHNLVACADRYQDAIMPGYTHLRPAQPITFAHWCLAYFDMFSRDHARLKEALVRLDKSPLGSGALAGTAYAIDRDQLATWLGFSGATTNSLDAVSSRDYVMELLSVAVISMNHLSRFSEDLILFNSGTMNFIELSDKVTSGSSLMPQKKNPDALELIRGRCGRVFGALSASMMTFKALPLAYNKDMQEDKLALFTAFDTWIECLGMAALVLSEIKIDYDQCRFLATQGYTNATELADYLVMKGVPFREAHCVVGSVVISIIEKKQPLEALSLSELQQFSSEIEQDMYSILSVESCLDKRVAKGGVAPIQVKQAVEAAKKALI